MILSWIDKLTDFLCPIAIESAALAEKLLNDLLKTTEGFQRLKKMNEELKVAQGNSDSRYVSLAHKNY